MLAQRYASSSAVDAPPGAHDGLPSSLTLFTSASYNPNLTGRRSSGRFYLDTDVGQPVEREQFRIAHQYRINQQIWAREVRIIGPKCCAAASVSGVCSRGERFLPS